VQLDYTLSNENFNFAFGFLNNNLDPRYGAFDVTQNTIITTKDSNGQYTSVK
jgi:hypothetical protein